MSRLIVYFQLTKLHSDAGQTVGTAKGSRRISLERLLKIPQTSDTEGLDMGEAKLKNR